MVLELAPTKGIQLISNYLGVKGLSVDELINVRLMLDPLISEMVASSITKKDIHQLDLLLRKHEKDYNDTGKSKFGWHFEQYLAILTRNKLIIVMEDLLIHLVRNIETYHLDSRRMAKEKREKLFAAYYRNTFEDHRMIAQAIMSHDPAGAREAMAKHRRNWARIFRQMVGGKKTFPLAHDAP
jgi:DNA-binding FadR family transcriptional regulator